MKKSVLFIIVIILIAFSFASESIAEKNVITLAFEDKESFPYYMGNSSHPLQNKPGASVEVVALAAKHLGITVRWKRMPWKRCLYSLGRNQIDGTFNASYKPERETVGVYPKTATNTLDESLRLVTVHYAFYKMKNSSIQWDGTNLVGLTGKIGVVLGYSVEKDLKKRGLPVDTAQDSFANIKKLLLGRVNLIAGSKSQIDSFLINDKKASNNIVEITTPLKVKSSYLIFSHDFFDNNQAVAIKLWEEIKEIRESKEYDKIFEKYYH